MPVNGGDNRHPLSTICLESGLALPRLSWKFRDINLILFPLGPVRVSVSLTHPSLKNSAKEPFSIRRRGFSPLLRSYYRQDSHYCLVHSGSPQSFVPRSTLVYPIAPVLDVGVGWDLGSQFSYHYLRDRTPRSVRCYPLLSGWVLLTLPPLCQWSPTLLLFSVQLRIGNLSPTAHCSVRGRPAYLDAPNCLRLTPETFRV